MKILVTGIRGQLGSYIKDVFTCGEGCYCNNEIIGTSPIELDVCNIKQVLSYKNKKLDLILHAAAETDHVAAEFNPLGAYMTNFTGTQNMVELAKMIDIPIVYIGTCGIFDGKKDSYKEDDQPTPLNHYGRSKYYGELAVKAYPKHWIFRCGWGMGGGPRIDKKFINKIYNVIKTGVTELPAVCDVYGSPTYQKDFAETIEKLVKSKVPYGTYNIGGERASRYDVAKVFVECLGLTKQVKVKPVTFDEFHKKFPMQVLYTKNEVMNLDKLNSTGLSAMRSWKTALKEYSLEYVSNSACLTENFEPDKRHFKNWGKGWEEHADNCQ